MKSLITLTAVIAAVLIIVSCTDPTTPSVTSSVKPYQVITSAIIEDSQKNRLVVVFSKPVAVTGTAPYGFAITGSPDDIAINSVSGAGDTWTFILNRGAAAAESITLSYNGDTVVDTVDNNPLKAVTKMKVTNNTGLTRLPAPAQPSLSSDGIASWSALSDETNAAKYEVRLYKGGSIQGEAAAVNKGGTYSHDFRTAIISGGAGEYTVKVKAIATAAAAASPDSTVSANFTATPLTLARFTWVDAVTATLSASDTIESGGSFVIPEGKALVIDKGNKITAGNLELGEGTWKATAAPVTIKTDQITMDSASAWRGKFGKDDGSAATVLAAPFEDGKDVSGTGWSAAGARVTLIQDGNNLTIKGANSSANFYVWNTGGIWVKAGLTIDTVTVNMDGHKPNPDTSWTSAIYMIPGSTVTFPNTGSRIKVFTGGGTDEFGSDWWGKSGHVTLGANIRMKRFSDADHRVTDIYVNTDGTGSDNKLTNVHTTDNFWIGRGFNHDS